MTENLRAGTYPAWKISTEHRWVDTEECAHSFQLPTSVADLLTERLCREASLEHANLATKLACLVWAILPKIGQSGFPLDRRALSLVDHEDGRPRFATEMVKSLGFSEWQARIAVTLLRRVDFVVQWFQQLQDALNTTWARWRRLKPFDPARGRDANRKLLRRVATLYQIGADFLRAYNSDRIRRARRAVAEAEQKRIAAAREAAEIATQEACEAEGGDADYRSALPDTHLGRSSLEEKAPSLDEEVAVPSDAVPFMGEKVSSGFFRGKNVLAMAINLARRTTPVNMLKDQDMVHRVLEESPKDEDGKPRLRKSESLDEALKRLGHHVLPSMQG